MAVCPRVLSGDAGWDMVVSLCLFLSLDWDRGQMTATETAHMEGRRENPGGGCGGRLEKWGLLGNASDCYCPVVTSGQDDK